MENIFNKKNKKKEGKKEDEEDSIKEESMDTPPLYVPKENMLNYRTPVWDKLEYQTPSTSHWLLELL